MTTLARLSFWVPAEHMNEFEAAHQAKPVPLLKKNELVESTKPSRFIVEGIFRRILSWWAGATFPLLVWLLLPLPCDLEAQ